MGYRFSRFADFQGTGEMGLCKFIRKKCFLAGAKQLSFSAMRLLEWLDRHAFLNIRIWDFSFRSLFAAYGASFLWKAVLWHPFKAIHGIRRYQELVERGLDKQDRIVRMGENQWKGGKDSILGVGFCLKPLDPPCPTGRSNHGCWFFENNRHLCGGKVPDSCARCSIRAYGLLALENNSCFYIMTSAFDILHDLFLPAIQNGSYKRGAFILCRYSFHPFALPLLMADMQFAIFPFTSGDCRDYATWLKADRGVKDEQTEVASESQAMIQNLFSSQAGDFPPTGAYKKVGNIFHPA